MIIFEVMEYIKKEINNQILGDNGDFVVLGNIAELNGASGTSTASLANRVVFTLVNIDEEKTLKNNPHYVRDGDGMLKRNPTVFLNLYVLFSCTDDYPKALEGISKIILFFQEKYVFTPETAEENFPEDYVEKIILDMFSLNFEQINHLWGTLGGKYYPSVLYKLRLLPVQANRTQKVGRVEEINTSSNLSN